MKPPFNWIQWLTVFTALFVAVTTPLILVQLQRQDAHRNDALRTIICYFERRAGQTRTLTQPQKLRALQLYNEALGVIQAPRCGAH